MPAVKTDNADPTGKLNLRRWFLDRYHSDGSARVFDCCQGSGFLWSEIRKTHHVASYWGVDKKKSRGRLSIDSNRVLAAGGWDFNVIDIDTYGSPWNHFVSVVHNASHPVIVFLTIGNQNRTAIEPEAHGGSLFFNLPAITPRVLLGKACRAFDVSMALRYASKYGTIETPMEAVSMGTARYLGLRYVPKKEGSIG